MASRRKHNLCGGSLRHRVTFESQALSTGHGGEANRVSTGWTVKARNVYAKVESLRGAEQGRNEGIDATLTTRVTVRYRTDITPDMRIKHGDRYLYPVAVYDPDGLQIKTICDCREDVR